ncbi:MAG: hypothetical protein ACI4PT_00175, partial [Candidatus Avoscillospira sp.]
PEGAREAALGRPLKGKAFGALPRQYITQTTPNLHVYLLRLKKAEKSAQRREGPSLDAMY